MTHLYETAKNLCISAWKYGYKFSNSSIYNESSLNLVELSQEINVSLISGKKEAEQIELTKTKLSDFEVLLEKLMNVYPQQQQHIEELKSYVKELVQGLSLGAQVKAA
ncbi:hypothetical protein SAMN05216474_2571 [Lishizhenia tianjinensis]|uniref:Four helix bundle protein n=1 Tax=Lishizhenia tianjinensis TaxID=477690 RepID=A0A1I7B5K5_9FLAO|nr:hypothetical protein [Lishizhenia tianjinensis]SFT82417.1 hypothetical protein SAMN05216474_2571 [Lishizhenia tianjinensis]